MKQKINPFDYAGTICNALSKGILITAKRDGFVNPMTIGWGHIGREWNRPIFVAYVRDSRHSYQMICDTAEFTVNAPLGESDMEIIRFCGSRSGREVDKVKALGLHLESPNVICAPGIREFPLTLECKVLFQAEQPDKQLPADIQERFYRSGDGNHIAFWGEIVDAYIITEDTCV